MPKRILWLLIGTGIGGAEKQYGRLYRHLRAHGRNRYAALAPAVLVRKLRETGIDLLEAGDVVQYGKPDLTTAEVTGRGPVASLLWRAGGLFALTRALRRHKPDIVHGIVGGVERLDSRLFASRCRVATHVTVDPRLLERPAYLRGLECSHAIEVLQTLLDEELAARGISSPERRVVADISFSDYSVLPPVRWPRQPRACFACRLVENKGLPELLQVMDLLHGRADADFVLEIMGEGPFEADLKAAIQRLGDGRFKYLGFHPRPTERMAEAMVFLSLQHKTNFPSQSLLEAMACGCAALATDVGDTHRLVDDEVGARVPRNAHAIADKLVWMLEHPDESEGMGRAGRERVLRDFVIKRYAEYLEGVYDRAWQNYQEEQGRGA